MLFHSLPGLLPGEHLVTTRAYKQLPSALPKRCGTKPLFSFLSGGTNKAQHWDVWIGLDGRQTVFFVWAGLGPFRARLRSNPHLFPSSIHGAKNPRKLGLQPKISWLSSHCGNHPATRTLCAILHHFLFLSSFFSFFCFLTVFFLFLFFVFFLLPHSMIFFRMYPHFI
mgnify:CR=1 FL=1